MRKVLGVIVILLFAGFTGTFAQSIDKVITVVGGSPILLSDIETQYADYLAQGNPADSSIRCVILQRLFTEKILSQQAVIDSVTVTDEQVDNEVDRRLRSMISRAGGQERLEQFLNRSVLQYKDMVRPQMKDQLVASKMQSQITEKVSVTPLEVKQFFDKIPKDSLPYINTEVEIGELIVYPKLLDSEKQSFKDKAEALRLRVKGGDDFATLARLYSQDPGSSVEGGELGFQDRTQLVKEFAAMAFKLKSGELSTVFESQFGFHVLQVIERRGEQVNARHILIKTEPTPASMDRAKAHIDSIYQNVAGKKITFSAAAATYSDNIETKYNGGMMLNAEEVENRTTYIPTNKLDPLIFATIDTMKVGSYSKPELFSKQIGEKDFKNGYRFYYLKSKTDPHRANLDQDFPKIKIAALRDKTDRTLSEWFEKRRQSTYIRIDKEYQTCPNLQPWITAKK
ncbi:MAG TPA: peptidylprolyl isomerase [Sphingobacteriaceae bacterium]|nr:peptidylprolyl isomerase [Sphingobacteriaceae bacterium]